MLTQEEMKVALKSRLPEEVASEELDSLLLASKGFVLDRRYPFGYSTDAVVPAQYQAVQIDIAVDLYNKKGAEGELAHSENGISRTYEGAHVSPQLLRRIMPCAMGGYAKS